MSVEKGANQGRDDRLILLGKGLLKYECLANAAKETPTSSYHEGLMRIASESAVEEGENTAYVPCRYGDVLGVCGVELFFNEEEASYRPINCQLDSDAE